MDMLCVKWEHLLGAIIQKDRHVFQTGFNSSYGKENKKIPGAK